MASKGQPATANDKRRIGTIDFTDGRRRIKIALTDGKALLVYDDVLSDNSPLLRRCIEAGDRSQVLELLTIFPGVHSSDLFNQYIKWLNKGNFATSQEAALQNEEGHDASSVPADHDYLVDLYLLALQLEDSTFQNAILDAMMSRAQDFSVDEWFHSVPSATAVNKIYNHTLPGCAARFVLLDIFVSGAVCYHISSDLHDDFLYDYAMAMTRKRGTPPRLKHAEENECCDEEEY